MLRLRSLAALACLLLAGCGGRAATPPSTDPAKRAERVEAPRAAVRSQDTEEDVELATVPRVEEPSGRMVHILRRGQTLYSVARRYGVDLDELMRINGISDPRKVHADRAIVIPGSRRRDGTAPAAAADPRLAWPLLGRVTAGYGRRGKGSHHSGLDIDGRKGDPILAAASGTVLRAGSDGRYGQVVILDHGNGLTTLYAHTSRLFVNEGERVRRGERIAAVGGSGNARGTHLHFEVRHDDRPMDPIPFLRDKSVLTSEVR